MDKLLGLGSSKAKELDLSNLHTINMDDINSRELHIAEIEQKLQNWSIPKVPTKKIYETGLSFANLFTQDYIIETTEKSLPVNPHVEQLELIDVVKLHKLKEKFRFMHIGLVQIAIKPLHRMGLNSPILMCLRDARFTSFTDSLLAVCESNLATGPVYFNCYPNFSVDLLDVNLSKTLTLNMQIPTTMMEESKNVAIIYRVHYKIMRSNLSPRAKLESGKESTILIEANYEHTNVHTPRLIQWDQVSFPDTWKIKNIIPPKAIKPRTQPLEILENDNGHAQIIFKPRINIESSRRSLSSRHESLISKADRKPSFKGVDWFKNIPQAHYEVGETSKVESPEPSKVESPLMSPTASEMNNSVYAKQAH